MIHQSSAAMKLLLEIAAALKDDGPFEVGTMFRSPGLRTENSIVAFLGRDDRIIVKLPRLRAASLIEDGTAEPVTMGTRTMREWVAIPISPDLEATQDVWTTLVREALHYVQQLPR